MRFRLIQVVVVLAQIAIASWFYAVMSAANPDIASSAISVVAAFIAFAATGIPIGLFVLAARLWRWLRRLPAKQGAYDVRAVRIDPP
jgi:hypothetical protein